MRGRSISIVYCWEILAIILEKQATNFLVFSGTQSKGIQISTYLYSLNMAMCLERIYVGYALSYKLAKLKFF